MLDTLTMDHVIANQNMLVDIKPSVTSMVMKTNAGDLTVDHRGTMAGVRCVWDDSDAISNIFSHARLADVYYITMDTNDRNIITIHAPFGDARLSEVKGLYQCPMDQWVQATYGTTWRSWNLIHKMVQH